MAIPTANQYLNASRRINTRVMPAYVSGLSPLRYPPTANLNLWLKADQISASNNDQIGTWSDQSGNARHATQSTTANKPVYMTNIANGRPGLWFNGTAYSMTAPMTTPAWGSTAGTLYVTLSSTWLQSATTNARTPFGWTTGIGEYWWYTTNTSYLGCMRDTRIEAASIAFTSGVHTITILSGASAYNVYDNTATLYSGSPSWGAAANALIGLNNAGNAFWLGFLHEILFYNVEHDAGQMTSIWNYLRWKWAIG